MKIVTLIPIFNPQLSFVDKVLPSPEQQSISSEIILIDSEKKENKKKIGSEVNF